MLGMDEIQVAITAEDMPDGNYKVAVQHEEILSERVLNGDEFRRFQEAIGWSQSFGRTPPLEGKRFVAPVSRKILEDFGFAEFYRAA